jgi:hypothetical protein
MSSRRVLLLHACPRVEFYFSMRGLVRRRVLLLHVCSGRRRTPAGLSDNLYNKHDFDAQSTQPFEPTLS